MNDDKVAEKVLATRVQIANELAEERNDIILSDDQKLSHLDSNKQTSYITQESNNLPYLKSKSSDFGIWQ